jgi:hypothetical protein
MTRKDAWFTEPFSRYVIQIHHVKDMLHSVMDCFSGICRMREGWASMAEASRSGEGLADLAHGWDGVLKLITPEVHNGYPVHNLRWRFGPHLRS